MGAELGDQVGTLKAGTEGHRLWGGRFEAESREALRQLNRSLDVDIRLWPHDVRASKAWVAALTGSGILDADEQAQLLAGLDQVHDRLASGAGDGAADEDVHTLVERLLYEEVGELAGKLNTGRSRNDQVATDIRLWMRDAIGMVDRELAALGRALVSQAECGIDLLLPGYTHGQRAQPIRWAYVLSAHAWPQVRNRHRLAELSSRISEMPLGGGALAGTGFDVDRESLKTALGFDRLSPNALDATGARDLIAELLFVLAMVATDASRLASELFTYSTAEYGFVRLSDGYCTGSSLLPQKRNPDVLELARAKPARVLGDLVGMLSLLRTLPAGYSKDLQEDKALLFDAMDTTLLTLPALRGAVEELEPNADRMMVALDETLLATDLADALVATGLPFRNAHNLVGNLVRVAESLSVPLTGVPDAAALTIHPELPRIVASLGSWEQSVERRPTEGGASRASVQSQLAQLRSEFSA